MTIEEILEELGIEFIRAGEHHHARPGWIQLDCPFCGKDSDRFHLGWNLSQNYTNCWRCGGHSPKTVLLALGVPKVRLSEVVRSLLPGEPIKRVRGQMRLKEPKGLDSLQKAHRKYLENRGFDPDELERVWQLQGIGISSRLSWRIYIPIVYRGEVVSWTTRSIGDKVTQRYISASAEEERISHKSLVYGQDYCRHSVIVVEGPVDAWRVGAGAGALFGTAFTAAQVRRIIQHPYRYIVFDSSKEAQDRAEELANQLSAFPGVTERIVLDAEDPGSATEREIQRLRRAAKM